MTCIVIYFVMAFIVASIILPHLIANHKKEFRCLGIDESDIMVFSMLSLLLAAVWPITIWAALITWWVSDETPAWVENISKLVNFIKEKFNAHR